MSLFGDKDANVEEVSRNNRIKKGITKQLATVLKSLQKEYGGAGLGSASSSQQPIYSGDLPSHLCLCIEAVFLHGLKKAKFRKRWSGYFGGDGGTGSDGDPQSYSFWPFVIKFTHKDTVAQLKRSQHLKCDVGLCRAWVRTALNEGLLESYLSAVLADSGATVLHYGPVAYLRDTDQPTILMGLLRGLGELTFALSYNMPSLNMWTTGALAIAGLVESGSSPATTVAAGLPQPSPSPSSATASVLGWTPPSYRVPAAADASLSAFGRLSTSAGVDSASSRPSEDGSGGWGTPVSHDATSALLGTAEEPVTSHSSSDSSRSSVVRNDGNSTDGAHRIAATGTAGVRRTDDANGDDDVVSTAVTLSSTVPEHAAARAQVPAGRSVLPSGCSADYDYGGDVDDSPSPLIYSSSSGRRNPFLSSSADFRRQAATAGEEPPLQTVAGGGGIGAAQQRSKARADTADDKDTSSCYSYDNDYGEEDSGAAISTAATTWAVPRPLLLEPVTGNSLGSLTGWASALGPADVAYEPPSIGGQAERGSDLRGVRVVASGGSRDHTPGGSPEYAASFDELMREYRPAWSPAPGHQVTSTSALPSQQQQQQSTISLDTSDGARGPGSSGGSNGSVPAKSEESPMTVATSATLGRQSPDSDYEVLDPYDGLLAEDIGECYGKICNEKGLDSQNYQCKDCGRPVGIVYGVPRVCSYDGCYYCVECHVNEECLVPAKIIFNWDFKRYRVSKRCKAYLQTMENHPLLTVSQVNAKLYDHVPELQECRMLRMELCCLRKYLFQCAQQIAEELKRKVWPNEFLYDDPDTYSVAALALVMSGQLAGVLRKAIAFAKAHVYDCVICRQKGFFCELCGSSKVIFPFETDLTVQCDRCRAVYHKACRRNAAGCPKCARIRKRQAALGAQHEAAAMRSHASLY